MSRPSIRIFLVLILFTPVWTHAHALPIAAEPSFSSIVQEAPKQIRVTFSERIDAHASTLTVTDASSHHLSSRVFAEGETSLAAEVAASSGVYTVAWSVVSADDGHFTKGAYSFVVGNGSTTPTQPVSEIVQISTMPEALAMTLELLGNGLLWATLLLFIFVVRPVISSFRDEERTLVFGYTLFVSIGVLCALSGGLIQLLIKSSQLSSLQATDFFSALHLYIGTSAGMATLLRMCAIAALSLAVIPFRKRITSSSKCSPHEIIAILFLCVFAYYRAVISHATANHFHPEFSILVNFFHVIEKDVWAGCAIILTTLAVVPQFRSFLSAVIPGAFKLLAIDVGVVSLTASYIVWLHLKTVRNLTTTEWGVVFLQLLIPAFILVSFRIYHACSRIWWPKVFGRYLAETLAAECAAALFVLYFSSVVIITSPPLAQPTTAVISGSNNGIEARLERAAHEDGMLLLTVYGKDALTPSATVAGDSEEFEIALSQRFNGGYAFPAELLSHASKLSVTVPQKNAYDAHIELPIHEKDFEIVLNWEARRSLDSFALWAIIVAISAFAVSVLLFWSTSVPSMSSNATHSLALALVFFFITAGVISVLASASRDVNRFRTECESDGNMWHLMEPTVDGVVTSHIPHEGCMALSDQYFFTDKREYDFNRVQEKASVSLEHGKITARSKTELTFSLKEKDGIPAKLFIEHQKLLHVVIVSKDMSVFAHIHPDDDLPLSQTNIDASVFTARYTFPKAGEYLVAIDYAHRLVHESKTFVVTVEGSDFQSAVPQTTTSPAQFSGYDVSLAFPPTSAGEVATLQYKISKDGKPVTDLEPYLGAAMHVAAVKNDFSSFTHTHGEYHMPGMPIAPITIKNGVVVHSMASMMLPPKFGPLLDAHLIFPSPGEYTIFSEFKRNGVIIPTRFSVRVD